MSIFDIEATKNDPLRAVSFHEIGWNWAVEFAPVVERQPRRFSSCPALTFAGDKLGRELTRLGVRADDFVFIDDSRVMFRKEDDASLCYLRFKS